MTQQAKLIIKSGPQAGQEIFLSEKPQWVLGRLPESSADEAAADVQFDNGNISRRHVRLSRQVDGVFELTDLDSTNGTFLWQKGKWRELKPQQPMPLFDQDLIRLGRKDGGVELQIMGVPHQRTSLNRNSRHEQVAQDADNAEERSVDNRFFKREDQLT